VLEVAATVVGLLGAAGVLVFAVLLLRPYALGFSMKAGETYRELWNHHILEQPMIDLALAEALDERRQENGETVRRLILWAGARTRIAGGRDRWIGARRGANLVSNGDAESEESANTDATVKGTGAGHLAQAATDDLQPRETWRHRQFTVPPRSIAIRAAPPARKDRQSAAPRRAARLEPRHRRRGLVNKLM
jgi:hypothetical protein